MITDNILSDVNESPYITGKETFQIKCTNTYGKYSNIACY